MGEPAAPAPSGTSVPHPEERLDELAVAKDQAALKNTRSRPERAVTPMSASSTEKPDSDPGHEEEQCRRLHTAARHGQPGRSCDKKSSGGGHPHGDVVNGAAHGHDR
jgi:hypothetical protein